MRLPPLRSWEFDILDWCVLMGCPSSALRRSSFSWPCPISVFALTGERLVIVRFRRPRGFIGAASSSDSSSSDEDEDDVEDSASNDFRVGTYGRVGLFDRVGVKVRVVTVSADDGGRKEGTGELVVLLRAWASRNAATDIRCDDSDATLSPRWRGRAGGSSAMFEEGCSDCEEGDSGRT